MRLQQPVFVVSMIGAFITAILAAQASFKLSLPDSSHWWLLLPTLRLPSASRQSATDAEPTGSP